MTTRYVNNTTKSGAYSPHYELLALYSDYGIINLAGIGHAGSDIRHYQRSMIMSKCSRCGRKLTVPVSIALGIGLECRGGKVGLSMCQHELAWYLAEATNMTVEGVEHG